MISRYSVENPRKGKAPVKEEKLYYKAEDELFLRSAELSFSFKTTFRETLADGTKLNIVGGGSKAPETQYKLIYVIKYSEYERRTKEIKAFLNALQ